MSRKIKRRKKYPYIEKNYSGVLPKFKNRYYRVHISKEVFIDLEVTDREELHCRYSGKDLGVLIVRPMAANCLILKCLPYRELENL